MGQYLQFRSWLRTSSRAERRLAGASVLAVVSLTAWSLLPTSSPDAGETLATGASGFSSGPTTTSGAATGAGGAVGGTTSGAAGTGTQGGGTAPGAIGPGVTAPGGHTGAGTTGTGPQLKGGGTAAGCSTAAPGATDVGVTGTTINVAATLLDLGGAIGNGAVGVASPQQQQQMSDAVVADVNAHGGVACRKIAVTYYSVNPINTSSAQQVCLQIAQAKTYAVVDLGGFSYPQGSADCVAQHKIPILTSSAVPSETRQYYPYFMSASADTTAAARTSILGLKRIGWFDPAKGFKKLGLYMDDCSPELDASMLKDLAGIGIPEKSISIYKFSCPGGGFGSASDASAAVIQHRQDGVTNVIPITGGGSFKSYSEVAARQGYKPKYTALDYIGQFITTTGATGPDQSNFDGSIGVTTTKIGMESSGFTDPATEACKGVFKAHGVDPAWVTNSYMGGNICGDWKVFAAAGDKAGTLTRGNLGLGLGQVGRIAMPYIYQDSIFKPGKLTGSDFSWVVQYRKSCNCWKVIDRTLRPTAC